MYTHQPQSGFHVSDALLQHLAHELEAALQSNLFKRHLCFLLLCQFSRVLHPLLWIVSNGLNLRTYASRSSREEEQ